MRSGLGDTGTGEVGHTGRNVAWQPFVPGENALFRGSAHSHSHVLSHSSDLACVPTDTAVVPDERAGGRAGGRER